MNHRSRWALLSLVALAAACGASPATTSPPPAPTETAAPPPSDQVAVVTPPPVLPPPSAPPVDPQMPPPPAVASVTPPAASATASSGTPLSDATTTGEASYYEPKNTGSCSLNPPINKMVMSASRDVYQNVQSCGACLEVSGGAGKMVVQVADLCFGCAPKTLVLSKPAFEATVGKQDGKGQVTWKTVPCDVAGKVAVRIKESSTRSWTAVQIRDSRLPLQLVEMKRENEGDWVKLTRSNDNYWAMAKGAGDDGFRLRITASTGQQIEEAVAKGWKDGKVYPGANQF